MLEALGSPRSVTFCLDLPGRRLQVADAVHRISSARPNAHAPFNRVHLRARENVSRRADYSRTHAGPHGADPNPPPCGPASSNHVVGACRTSRPNRAINMEGPLVAAPAPATLPLYSPQLFLALRKVSRGRIGATKPHGVLSQGNDDLDSGVFSALFLLRRDGFITLVEPQPNCPGWYAAVLTMRGTQLLSAWQRGSRDS